MDVEHDLGHQHVLEAARARRRDAVLLERASPDAPTGRSHDRRGTTASRTLCVTNTNVLPSSVHTSCSSFCRISRICASSAPNGSSASSTSGWQASARARAARWRMPPESSCGCRSANAERWTFASQPSAVSRISRGPSPVSRSAYSTFWRTLSHGNSAGSWNRSARSGPGSTIGRPSIRTCPSSGSSSPASRLRIVDLPHPDGPIRQTNSPVADVEGDVLERGDPSLPSRSCRTCATPRTESLTGRSAGSGTIDRAARDEVIGA